MVDIKCNECLEVVVFQGLLEKEKRKEYNITRPRILYLPININILLSYPPRVNTTAPKPTIGLAQSKDIGPFRDVVVKEYISDVMLLNGFNLEHIYSIRIKIQSSSLARGSNPELPEVLYKTSVTG
ncbi:hypothetical protein N7478_002399 [Penicillium angulare]|uniref:uncharacterized protein n=1 Tax=Penicillium angulare TaxID=116970 RepID=UPI0025402A05|nr:uncharacterized protein N7478_002399 [Penicillium angulare]KAJ5286713.1 hypothetical protein N7478_002399 [Penicillium angulare]